MENKFNMIKNNNRLLIIVVIVAFLLLIPLIARQYNEEVSWNMLDFVVAGVL